LVALVAFELAIRSAERHQRNGSTSTGINAVEVIIAEPNDGNQLRGKCLFRYS
jgi:hypothetical protein